MVKLSAPMPATLSVIVPVHVPVRSESPPVQRSRVRTSTRLTPYLRQAVPGRRRLECATARPPKLLMTGSHLQSCTRDPSLWERTSSSAGSLEGRGSRLGALLVLFCGGAARPDRPNEGPGLVHR